MSRKLIYRFNLFICLRSLNLLRYCKVFVFSNYFGFIFFFYFFILFGNHILIIALIRITFGYCYLSLISGLLFGRIYWFRINQLNYVFDGLIIGSFFGYLSMNIISIFIVRKISVIFPCSIWRWLTLLYSFSSYTVLRTLLFHILYPKLPLYILDSNI